MLTITLKSGVNPDDYHNHQRDDWDTLRQITITALKTALKKLTSATIAATTCALVLLGSSLATSNNNVSTLLTETGVAAQVRALKSLVKESSIANATRCDSQPINKQLPSFSPQSVIFDIESAFSQINSASLEPIYSWYRSPLAKKIHIAEKQITAYASLRDFVETARYKDPKRTALIQKIVRNTQTAEFVATLGTEIEYAGLALSGCIEKAATSDKANSEQMLADFTRNDKDLTATLLMSDITAETSYLFRNLSTEELAQYEAYTSDENSRQFYQNLIAAVQQALTLAGDRISLSHTTRQATAEF